MIEDMKQASPTDPVAWAMAEAQRLREVEHNVLDPKPGVAVAAVEFLRSQAGPRSAFSQQAERFLNQPTQYGSPAIANVLENWVKYVQTGLATALPPEAQTRIEASSDLMSQVQMLLEDKTIHPAAPIVLTGAGLEEFLRGLVEANDIKISRKPGIMAYADALKKEDVLSAQDNKDINSWSGLRNDAAHGRFEETSRERAVLMADGVNLFMRQKSP